MDWPDFRARFFTRRDAIRAEIMHRSTQTNEPARCAVLLPFLARLAQPFALIEVGASAGLCLLADRYGYRYEGHAAFGGTPRFPCRMDGETPTPDTVPNVVWRMGLDLNPLDVMNDDAMAWLEALVWPDQPDRLERLRGAIALARINPAEVVEGDLLTDLPALAAKAPSDATLVIFHTAVLAYVVESEARARFAAMARDLDAVWISNESPGVFPAIAARMTKPRPPGAFLLAVDGEPMAWTDPHGAWLAA